MGGDPISDAYSSSATPLLEDLKEPRREGSFENGPFIARTPALTPFLEQNETSDNGQTHSAEPATLLGLVNNRSPGVVLRRAWRSLTRSSRGEPVTLAASEESPSTSSGSSSRLYSQPDLAVVTEESEKQNQGASAHGSCSLERSPVCASPDVQACQDKDFACRVPEPGCVNEPILLQDFFVEENYACFDGRLSNWGSAKKAQEVDGGQAAAQRVSWDGGNLQDESQEQQNTQQGNGNERDSRHIRLRPQGLHDNDILKQESQDDQAQAVFDERRSEWAEAAQAQEADESQAAVQQGSWDEEDVQDEDQEQGSMRMLKNEHGSRQGTRFRHRGPQDSDIPRQESQDDRAQTTSSERFNEWGGVSEAEELEEGQAAVHQGVWEEALQDEEQEQQSMQRLGKGLRQGAQNEWFHYQGFQDYDIRRQESLVIRAQLVSGEPFDMWTRATEAQKVDESQALMQEGIWFEEDLQEESHEQQGKQKMQKSEHDLRLGSLRERFYLKGFQDNDISWQESQDDQVSRPRYSGKKERQMEPLFKSLTSPLWECQKVPLTLKSCMKKQVVKRNGQARAVAGPSPSLPKRQALRWRSMADVMTIECDTAPAEGLVSTTTEALQEEPTGCKKVWRNAIKLTLCDKQACTLWAMPVPCAEFTYDQFP